MYSSSASAFCSEVINATAVAPPRLSMNRRRSMFIRPPLSFSAAQGSPCAIGRAASSATGGCISAPPFAPLQPRRFGLASPPAPARTRPHLGEAWENERVGVETRARRASSGIRVCTVMSTTTSLALQSLLLNASTQTGLSRPVSRITGLAGSARPLAAAAAAHRQKGVPVLFVLPTDQDLDDAVDDTRFFLQTLEGLTDADVERVVLPLPSLQVDPYRGPRAAFSRHVCPRPGLVRARRRAGPCGRGLGARR